MSLLRPGLYGIADAGFGDPVVLGRLLISAGAVAVQLRCKGWGQDEVRAALMALRGPCREAGVPLIVNDYGALAGLCDGVHLGQGDGVFPPGARVRGRSTHGLADLAAAEAEGVDYVGFGPVYGTTTKPDARSRRGVEALTEVCAAARVPVVAIGGITLARSAEVYAAGASCVAVISGVFGAGDPWAAARGVGR